MRLPIVTSVAVAVAALTGAFVAGDSVRASLRDLVLERLGRTTHAIEAPAFVREALAEDLAATPGFAGAYAQTCPLIVLDGFVTHETSSRRRHDVDVFGVDDRFWRFHGRDVAAPQANEAYLSAALARDLGALPGDGLLVRMAKPSVVPAEWLFGRRDDIARSLHLTVKAVLRASDLGDFSLRASQTPVRAIFVSLGRLQRALERQKQINLILVSERERGTSGEQRFSGDLRPKAWGQQPEAAGRGAEAVVQDLRRRLREAVTLDDVGVTVRAIPGRAEIAVEGASGRLSDAIAAEAMRAADTLGLAAQLILSHVVNSISHGERRIPYSFVTATDLQPIVGHGRPIPSPEPRVPISKTPPSS